MPEQDILYVDGKRGKKVHIEQYQDLIGKLHPEFIKLAQEAGYDTKKKILSRVVTFQVTDRCNLKCSYCYQINKGTRRLKFEDAKALIDMLLDEDPRLDDYINTRISPAIIIEFIGGEPFLEIDLIDQITEYFKIQAAIRHHPWATMHMISICSNGTLYFTDKVQKYLEKNKNNMSFSITIDGNKELHDSCRVFPDGRPSYDLASAAAKDWMAKGNYMGSKITIAPGNIKYLYNAIVAMVDFGYNEINANCVYEKGWNLEYAKIFYEQLKKVADYWSEHNLYESVYLSLFEEHFFRPKHEDDIDNWCFKAGTMILTPNGEVPIETINIGDYVISADGNPHIVSDAKSRMAEDTASVSATGMLKTFTTKDHPYLAKRFSRIRNRKAEWVKVSNIKDGDRIALYKQDSKLLWAEVNDIHDEEPYEVFNLTVEDTHNFIANGAVVHNCGGVGSMLSIDPDGRLFPCIRYMESSLGDEREPFDIGNIHDGIGQTELHKQRIKCLNCITRKTESTEECFNCPIADGCSWCSAYNYQVFGTPDSRATFICVMHKARSLANAYFWNKYYKANNKNEVFKVWCPDDWALEIIDKEELDYLKDISKVTDANTIIVNDKQSEYNG